VGHRAVIGGRPAKVAVLDLLPAKYTREHDDPAALPAHPDPVD
jgi:hypothetical protein